MKKELLFTVLAIFISLTFVRAQSKISGRITDNSNHPIAGASVVLYLQGANIAGTISDINGQYKLERLKSGTYSIKVNVTGYAPATAKDIVLNGKANKVFDFKLQTNHQQRLEIASAKRKSEYRQSGFQNFNSTSNFTRSSGDVIGAAGGLNYYDADLSNESYKHDNENGYKSVKNNPLSTISVDVDRASYSNVRRFLNQGQKPPADAVRIEEMVNYFNYDYPQPKSNDPIAITTELSECPWNKTHKLLHIGLQARTIDAGRLPASNLVFLIDVSGSMATANKLPLVKSALKLLTNNLREKDKVSIVVYAGSAGLVLPPTNGSNKTTITDALERLQAGGSTAGGAGIQLAYKTAEEQFIKGGNNRIIIATDGDFNVGINSEGDLEKLITEKRSKGIFLTCLGFGMGNYKDSKLETLADKGNGNYAYIDNIQEAQKTLVSEFGGTLFTVAKDVKTQIEFNPAKVQGYRLVGYENRLLNNEDFKDDKKDAAEMGSGHSVTILYEIIPAGISSPELKNDVSLKYQQANVSNSNDLATVKFRYKQPDGNTSKEIIHPIGDRLQPLANTSSNFRFSASVAMFGMLLKDSPYKGNAAYEHVIALAETARTEDKEGYKAEYIRLVKSVK